MSQTNSAFEAEFGLSTTGGAFTISVNGMASAPVAYPPSASSLQAALVAVPTAGAGTTVEGPVGGPFLFDFGGENAGQPVATPIIDGSALIPVQQVLVREVRKGKRSTVETDAASAWEHFNDVADLRKRYLYVKRGLLETLIGQAAMDVDNRTGTQNIVESKESQRYAQLAAQLDKVEGQIREVEDAEAAGTRRTWGGPIARTTPNGLDYGVMRLNPRTRRPR